MEQGALYLHPEPKRLLITNVFQVYDTSTKFRLWDAPPTAHS